MKYDFDNAVNRLHTDSYKWNIKDDELPMWVADMDFKTCPEILEDVVSRAQRGCFGYNTIPDEWYEAYINWWDRRHHYKMEKEWLIYCIGVIPAISSTVRKITTPNENVILQTPVYNCFYNCIINSGRRVLENKLIYKDGKYEIDFDDLEKKLSDPQTSLMILCNPHNPIGKIWSKEELQKIGELAIKHGVIVLSDEIHCDITEPGKEYIPFASVSAECKNNSITCIAPTKAFNLAGLMSSAISVPDKHLRHKIWRNVNTEDVAEPNSFSTLAAISAFNKGEDWLNELNEYISNNRSAFTEYCEKNIPDIYVIPQDSTYLLWVDVSKICKDSSDFAKFARKETGLFVNPGEMYGEDGKLFLRVNIACPLSSVKDGLERLKKSVEMYKNK